MLKIVKNYKYFIENKNFLKGTCFILRGKKQFLIKTTHNQVNVGKNKMFPKGKFYIQTFINFPLYKKFPF